MFDAHALRSVFLFDDLEPRQLFSAGLLGTQLVIVGTHKSDNIRVYVNPSMPGHLTVVVNQTTQLFPAAAVEGISVQAGQGNDVIAIDLSRSRYPIPTTLYGSGGNDTIVGGAGTDRVYGGDGNDVINGRLARDILYGDAGDDSIDGDQGNDYLVGGLGNDTLRGGVGIDYHFGEAGNDFIDSIDGSVDHVDGGDGTDRAVADMILDKTFVSIENFIL